MSRLYSWLLNGVYLTLILLALPWIAWSAVRHGKYRGGFAAKLWGRVPTRAGNRPCVWLHAVSVGEVNLLATTLKQLRQSRPHWDYVISTTTKTGYDLARRKYAEHTVFYCPLDFSWAVKRTFQRVRPNLLVLAELELWPNMIRAAKAHGAQVAVINGRLSDKSFRGYRRLRPLVVRLLERIDVIAAQNEDTAQRFVQLGADPARVTVTGSLKFDGAVTDRRNSKTRAMRELAHITDEQIVLLAGSTQAPEEQYAIEVYQRLSVVHPQLRLIIVPRHPERFDEVAELLDRSRLPWCRRSQLDSLDGNNEISSTDVSSCTLLVDSIGELGAWWGTASIGLVGGSFGSRGGQNMLEPAAYGVATCFGPNTRNFRDIVAQLLGVKGAEVVHDRQEFEQFSRRALAEPEWASQMGTRARDLMLSQQGATQRTVNLLLPLIEETVDDSTELSAA